MNALTSFILLICEPASIILRNRLMQKTRYKIARSISTINIKDIENHSKLAKIWWTDIHMLHHFNPLRVQFVRDGLANTGFKEQTPSLPLQGVKIADVGCGGGILSEGLARTGAEVTGIDASEELINVAKQHVELDSDISNRINYICTNIEEFSDKNEKLYDVVISSEVIEHVNNQELFLKESIKLLKPGGSIFITTPNKTLLCWLAGIVVSEYIINVIPRGTHDWNNFIPPHEVQRILRNNGCKTKLIHGIVYNPITKQWSWSSSTALCYGLHAVKQK
ncbi:PREDICTED: ubiquinone biosynthesis O-methyltransferase, mitochondrial-like [Dinoponera quadriceps]|uniref:Ubiquinone biosynthesis O-methyltransferase, mitochondrial n=1 Tax=Dinoponera quadriceps TaxID=609295 RepID=A0A6P3WS67_DINQU|nr:PREDICTED: ubiquinone biosynthesis O-methyltransferase, mitochondrial-like [Dinoponera quadriceps]